MKNQTPATPETVALQTDTFYRHVCAVVGPVKDGLAALDADSKMIAGTQASRLPQAIEAFQGMTQASLQMDAKTLSHMAESGKAQREKGFSLDKLSLDPVGQMIVTDPAYRYVVGHYADAAIKVYEAAKAVSTSPESKGLTNPATATFCAALEKDTGLMSTLKGLAQDHRSLASAVPSNRRFDAVAPFMAPSVTATKAPARPTHKPQPF